MVLFLGLIDLPHTHIRMVFQEGVKHGLQAFHSGSGGCTGQDAVQRVFPPWQWFHRLLRHRVLLAVYL